MNQVFGCDPKALLTERASAFGSVSNAVIELVRFVPSADIRQGLPLPLLSLSFIPMYRRNWPLSASISSWTSWTSGNVQNHAVPNTSFRLSNSNPGRVDEVALARGYLNSRRNSLFIVDPYARRRHAQNREVPPTSDLRPMFVMRTPKKT